MLRTILYSTLRQYSRKRVAPRRRNPNPGVQNRMQGVGVESQELLDNDVDFDEMESDFFGAHRSYDDHVVEMEKMLEKDQHYLVKHKYFKQEKQPSFLTWNDVEQIRYLHQKNPEEWTIERLSDSFPALPGVIHKICKTNYTRSEESIEIYNETVKRNWEQFKTDQLKLPEYLKEHLNKFTSRELNFSRFPPSEREKAIKSLPKPAVKKGSFSEIITSYNKLKSQNTEPPRSTEIATKDYLPSKFDTKITRNQKQITLTELTTKLERKKLRTDGDLSHNENMLLQIVDKHKKPAPIEPTNPEIIDITKITKEVTVQEPKHKRDTSHLVYPEKINIPKEHYRKGLTYKLNDCFYDSHGFFLYRVPGME